MATAVLAQSPHYITGPAASIDSKTGDLCVSFKEAGLGTATSVTYTINVGTTAFTFQCFTKSNNTPQGSPNGVSTNNVSFSEPLPVRNGQVTGTICLNPCQGGSCQGGGLVLKLIGAEYQNVTFSDGITTPVTLGNFGPRSIQPPIKASTLPSCQ
jgi:hypothetical protein